MNGCQETQRSELIHSKPYASALEAIPPTLQETLSDAPWFWSEGMRVSGRDAQAVYGAVPPYRRHLRGPARDLDRYAAGKMTTARFKGIRGENPLLGPGLPPQDDIEAPERRAKGISSFSHLSNKRDILGQSGYEGCGDMDAIKGRRHLSEPPSKAQSLTGGAVLIHEEIETPIRRARGHGAPHPAIRSDTNMRIMGVGCSAPPPPKFAKRVDICRTPTSADVIKYRFSGGICPEYKFHDFRFEDPSRKQTTKLAKKAANALPSEGREQFLTDRAKAMGLPATVLR
ncbi:hypothetical protein BSKO_13706 [Bryopsis sp. KO-2023]|nr:hypothetical protein BSKO_13706 [Bryopsis sp. KO-2023]